MAHTNAIERETEQDVAEAVLETGMRVEVRRRFDGSWTRGFEIAGTSGDGYLLRRLSDGSANWGESAESALAQWNSHLQRLQFRARKFLS